MDNNEYYTSDDGNLEEGQATEDVGQDEGTTQSKSSSDWKNQAKYFQSEKDKLYAENEKLRQLAKVLNCSIKDLYPNVKVSRINYYEI